MPGCHRVADLGKRAQEMDPLTQQTSHQDAGQLEAGVSSQLNTK